MEALTQMATLAAQARIRGRSFKRSSRLKPLDIILDLLERDPRPSMREVVRKAAEGDIFDHIYYTTEYQYRPGREKQLKLQDVIHEYVQLFFSSVLDKAYKGDVNRLLRSKRMLRSAYLIDYRAALDSPEEKEQLDKEEAEEAQERAEQADE